MKNLQDLARNALISILKTFKHTDQPHGLPTEHKATPFEYHIVHNNKPKLMDEAEFTDFKRKTNRSEYYVEDVVPRTAHN